MNPDTPPPPPRPSQGATPTGLPTPAELAEWRALAEEATEGEWRYDGIDYVFAGNTMICEVRGAASLDFPEIDANGRFLAAARQAVPRLLEAVDTLQRKRAAAPGQTPRLPDDPAEALEALRELYRDRVQDLDYEARERLACEAALEDAHRLMDAALARAERLQRAVEEAAQSLETIFRWNTREDGDLSSVRGYAASRARVARAAMEGEQT